MLVLTEKPSVAKAFAAALGVPTSGAKGGFFEGGGHCITWALGHLFELQEPEAYDAKYRKWNLADLPIIPEKFRYAKIPATSAQLEAVEGCFKRHKGEPFLLATDAEREGEVIGAEILNYVGFSDWQNAKRFWVSEALTPEIVKKGIESAKPLLNYESYKKAGFARARGDWLVGMNFSRAIGIMSNSRISFGRVQTALLCAIANRENEIKNFVAEPYFEVFAKTDADFLAKLQNDKKESKFSPESPFLKSALENLREGGDLEIVDVKKSDCVENPPQLFNLTGLQKVASQKLHFSPDKTLQIAQNLYEVHKCQSYPRTPSTVLGDENVALFKEKFDSLSKIFPEKAAGCDIANISATNKRVFNSSKLVDHHALIPLAQIPNDASDDEKAVYNLVLERFFDCIKKPFRYQKTEVFAKSADFDFSATGRTVIDEGFRAFSKSDDDDEAKSDDEMGKNAFPADIAVGKSYKIAKLEKLQKMTKPKKHFTESSLLALMENPKNEGDDGKLVGLGTPATRAEIIKKLFVREYVEKQKQNILTTEKGEKFVAEILKNQSLKDFVAIEKTTEWEEKLESSPDEFLAEIKSFVKDEIPKLKIDKIEVRRERKILGKCPLCQKDVAEFPKSFSHVEWKDNPCKFAIWKDFRGGKIGEKDAEALLAGKLTRKIKMKSKAGKDFEAPLRLEGGEIKFAFEENERERQRAKPRTRGQERS